jgi:hypothetical protein
MFVTFRFYGHLRDFWAGQGEVQWTLPDGNRWKLHEVLRHIGRAKGDAFQQEILDPRGEHLNPELTILVNDRVTSSLDIEISEGAMITLIPYLPGG